MCRVATSPECAFVWYQTGLSTACWNKRSEELIWVHEFFVVKNSPGHEHLESHPLALSKYYPQHPGDEIMRCFNDTFFFFYFNWLYNLVQSPFNLVCQNMHIWCTFIHVREPEVELLPLLGTKCGNEFIWHHCVDIFTMTVIKSTTNTRFYLCHSIGFS